ncbi:hypothetical protein APHCRT_0905 [Anaplasma phagocytophilum str. CRT53-1]|uniref:Uncharacterized protein n=1 Tax=Anaplasma phagocytophilum str. CRT53-1 TaxID=1359157 RepID=A0A0F3PZZ0_ANAPH|nr:hypothetical protein APHCRT_0914 [Anaplasma phagocytophilum str. CRT53-1]KJV85823.1 hypothetical protein APHCRT_0905 [Anaplasma phagocytophilum str. CRT53-1]
MLRSTASEISLFTVVTTSALLFLQIPTTFSGFRLLSSRWSLMLDIGTTSPHVKCDKLGLRVKGITYLS